MSRPGAPLPAQQTPARGIGSSGGANGPENGSQRLGGYTLSVTCPTCGGPMSHVAGGEPREVAYGGARYHAEVKVVVACTGDCYKLHRKKEWLITVQMT